MLIIGRICLVREFILIDEGDGVLTHTLYIASKMIIAYCRMLAFFPK